MSSGSQPRQTPVKPSRCSQQPVTKNGGNPNPTTAPAIHQRRQRHFSPDRKSATKNPIATARSVVSALTSRLFLSSVQFIGRSSQENPLRFCRARLQIGQQPVPIRLERHLGAGRRRHAFERARGYQLLQHVRPLEIDKQFLGGLLTTR